MSELPGRRRTTRSYGAWRAVNRAYTGRRWLGATSLLGAPLAWMLFVYTGSLVALVVSATNRLDPKTQKPSDARTWDNLRSAFTEWNTIEDVLRTALVALLVTLICFLISVPVAFFISKIAWPWIRRGIVVALLLPLWAGYLVKGYAWRAMVSPAGGKFAAAGKGGGGFLESTTGWTPGYGRVAIILTLVYFWLPYMVLPIYAGLDRMPTSLFDASGDLGARPFRTFRSVVLPLLMPSVAAGSIFTFSLSLGDYIVPQIVNQGEERFLFGSVINSVLGAPNQPMAAALTLWPLAIIILYLLAMKRLGAFENL